MADAKDNWVVQSPKAMAAGEAIAYTFDFTDVGTPASVSVAKAYKADGTEVDTTLSGATSIAGDVVTFKLFTPTLKENHRLVCGVIISGNTVFSMLDVAVYDPTPNTSAIAIASFSYGSVAGVAALTPKWRSKARLFDDTTNPSLSEVVNWIDEISSMLNAMLATEGFATPITDVNVIPSLRSFINGEVAAMVEGVHGSGRFGPTVSRRSSGGGKSRYSIIRDDMEAFVKDFKTGMEAQGAERERDFAEGIAYRETDASGDTVPPLFEREAYGNAYEEWDQ